MKDPVARQRAEEASRAVEAEAVQRKMASADHDAKIEQLRRLVRESDEGSLTAINPLVHSSTFGVANPNIDGGVIGHYFDEELQRAVRTAVLTIVLCYENLRDALQFDTWGGLQDATGLDERAQVLRGWLGMVTDEETAAATACYDELAGT